MENICLPQGIWKNNCFVGLSSGTRIGRGGGGQKDVYAVSKTFNDNYDGGSYERYR